MFVSVIVPCYNEEPLIRETHRRLTEVLEQLENLGYELVYVDDGSKDETPAILEELHITDEHMRVLQLSRNFGHQIAVTAGLEHASGDAVIVIDADLQDPPEVILEMVQRWRDGYDVVYGVRIHREGETAFKLWTAKLFYRLMNRLSDTKMPLDVGDFRLIDRKVVDALLVMPERDRYLRGMVTWVGFKQVGVMYRRAARFAGVSKYPFLKMVQFAADGALSFSIKPLRLAIWAGVAAISLAIAGILYAVVLRLYTTNWVRGWASIFVAVLFMGGVQLLSLGIMGEYVGRIYGEVKHRPLYFLRERVGLRRDNRAAQLDNAVLSRFG